MRLFIVVLIVIFSLQSWTQADDITEFEIEGISIGDSALKYYDKETIISNTYKQPYKDDEYYTVEFINSNKTYETITLSFKKSDKNFIIHSLTGYNYIKYEECLIKQKLIADDINSVFKNIKNKKNYTSDYGDDYGKSFAKVIEFVLENGSVRIWCDNFDKTNDTAKQWPDAINVDLSTEKFLYWLDNIAYQ